MTLTDSSLDSPNKEYPLTNVELHSQDNHEDHLNERAIFDYLLRPDDSYDQNGVYWADLSIADRIRFVSSYNAAETKREFNEVVQMAKKNPFSPIASYFRTAVLPGAGLGLEG